jgi:hypothetical protein
MSCDREGVVRRRISGVSIGGVPWNVGDHCLYQDGPGGATRIGTVTVMFHGTDVMMDEFVIFQLANKLITACLGHYCLFTNDGHDNAPVFVLWTKVSWKCKTFKMQEEHAYMALPFVPCSSVELIEFR